MLKNQRGLTLVEIIISLAISALLLASVLVGRDGLRSQLQLSQGADQWVQTLGQARTEGTNAVGNTNTASGGTSDNFIFGKQLTLQNGSSKVTVQTLTYNQPTAQGGPGPNTFTATTNSYTVTMPWSVAPTNLPNATTYITFGQADASGIPAVYVYSTSVAGVVTPVSTLDSAKQSSTFTFQVKSSAGKTALINIDQYGNITRTIQ